MKTSVVTDLPHTGSRVNGILRSKKTWIVILALVLVVAGGYTAYRVLSAQASVDTAETPEVQTCFGNRHRLRGERYAERAAGQSW
jgi:hypothetical protein